MKANVLFQSTHPSGVRLTGLAVYLTVQGISIHAPQWGATTTLAVDPAPVQFQSTHPSGVRLNYRVWRPNIVIISIHAPQWGATAGYFL